jgi:3-hydroxyacyl-[acyl-carrier-protein] dehydratase
MRWYWIDKFVEFISGERAVAVKNITLSDEPLEDYQPGYPAYPNSLIVEGMAQTGGILVCESNGFEERVVLAKIGKAAFHLPARPGDTLRYQATIEDLQPDGAIVHGKSYVGDDLQAEMELVFAHLDERFAEVGDLFDPADFLAILRVFELYDIGRKPDGTPIEVPKRYLEAEAATAAAT